MSRAAMKTLKTFLLPLFLLFTTLLTACGGGGGSSPTAATYSVVYSANGSTGGAVPSDTKAYAASSTATVLGNTGALVKTGYVFTGWNTAANGSGTAYAAGASLAVGSGSVTLYAAWVRQFTQVTTLAGTAGSGGSADGTGTAALFNGPSGVATGGTNLYVADSSSGTIRKLAIATGAVTTLAGSADGTGYVDGTGAAARFYLPNGITTDGTNLYVADSGNSTIRKVVIATGVVSTLAGTARSEGSTDGTGTAARFKNPGGVATDGTNLYVTDGGNSTIRKVVIATGVVTTLVGTAGSSGSTDDTGAAARFDSPKGITTDGTNLYVTDGGNSTIRKVVIATGVVTTLAGTAGSSGSTDGTGTGALFGYPQGITTDGSNLYVTDALNTIRKVVIATGVVTTLAGAAGSNGSADGTGAAARFYGPNGVTTDGTNLYVADTFNSTIRKIQ